MFRINYSDLNKEQVESIIGLKPAPGSLSGLCGCLAGKELKIVTDKKPVEGPTLEYSFSSDTGLTLVENGAPAVECAYGALSLKNITLFSHMIPGTKRGYNVIVNWDTAVVTVFEMWFIDYQGKKIDTTKECLDVFSSNRIDPYVNREVQRQCYTGYFERNGCEPPTARDRLSLRLENKMLYWIDDRRNEQIVTYTSNVFSTMVELNKPDGEDVLTFPSDILQISDNLFIYSRGEVEYSGRLIVEVIDLFTMKKIGVTMGIDENDKFEYLLYKACGRMLCQYSTFYDFNDRGDRLPEGISNRIDYSVKGARATYRTSILSRQINEDELRELAKNVTVFANGSGNIMISDNHMAESRQLAGKCLTLRYDDGTVLEYEFLSDRELRYRRQGDSEWLKEEYRANQLDEDLVFMGHYVSGSYPPNSIILALDFSNGCTTCIDAKVYGKYDLHDVIPTYRFGVIETEGLSSPRMLRHCFTRELLGRSFTWTYSDGISSQHIYNAPEYYSWTIFTNGQPGSPANRAGGFVWSSPCTYIKLRDDVYIVTWVEEKWAGTMGCVAMNLRLMHDCGFNLHIEHDGSSIGFDQMGALAREAGRCDLSGYFTLKHLGCK